MAPSLQRISDKEYEITAAASQDDSEALADGMGGRDETRQFNLHSSEAVVHFLQRIDELSDENRDLRAALADRDQMLKTKQQEGSDTVQRSALLQSAVDKLRQELGRRNARIKQLQSQIAGELTAASSAASLPTGGDGQGPGSSGDTTSVVLRSPSDQEQIVDMPTLEVHRLDEGDLR